MGLRMALLTPGNAVDTDLADKSRPEGVIEIGNESLLRGRLAKYSSQRIRQRAGVRERVGKAGQQFHFGVERRCFYLGQAHHTDTGNSRETQQKGSQLLLQLKLQRAALDADCIPD